MILAQLGKMCGRVTFSQMIIERGSGLLNLKRCSLLFGFLAVAASVVLGLSVNRLLFEGLFPRFNWIGSPLSAVIFSLLFGFLGWLGWRWLAYKLTAVDVETGRPDSDEIADVPDPDCRQLSLALIPFLPLFLNAFYIFESTVSLLENRSLIYVSLWLGLLFLTRLLVLPRRWMWLGIVFCVVLFLPIYMATLGQLVGTADTFEFQVTVPQLGIAHPTGYPLFLLLSKPFTWIPINSVAWRVNLATLIFALSALVVFYLLLYRLTRLPVIAVITTVVMGLTPTFWSQAIQAEVYSLNALIVLLLLFLMREIGRWSVGDSNEVGPKKTGNKSVFLSILLAFVFGLV